MPRELFAQSLASTASRTPKRSRWTVAGSIAAHAAVVGGVVILPVLGTIDSPVIARRLAMFASAPPLPTPPPIVRPPAPAPTASAATSTVPIEASDRIVDAPPAPTPALGFDLPIGAGAPPTAFGPECCGKPGAYVPPPPDPPKPVTTPIPVGGNIHPPQRLSYAAPVYPAVAQTAKVEGLVILEATIDEAGVVRDVKVLRSIPLLDRAAIEAVSKWRYTPTRLNGVAVPVTMVVTVTFTLQR